jgi:hypothetical protein
MRATNIKATRGAAATKAVAVGGRACARELYTMKQCCLGSGVCCLYSTRAHTRNKNDVFDLLELLLVLPKSLAVTRIFFSWSTIDITLIVLLYDGPNHP